MKIYKDNNHDIGFVLWCLGCEAVDMNEFQQWILHVIEIVAEPPGYIFDLLDFKGYMKDIDGVMGFTPDWSPSKDQIFAMTGIAFLRGIIPFEPADKEQCMKALMQDQSILEKYKEMFPFIKIKAQPNTEADS